MGAPTLAVQPSQSSQPSGKTGSSSDGAFVNEVQNKISPNEVQNKISPNVTASGKTGGAVDRIFTADSQNTLTPQPMQGTQGTVTFPGQGGQPEMGQPNKYSNTVGSWDNSSTGMSTQLANGGKGKGKGV
jgi:hypothetical protein